MTKVLKKILDVILVIIIIVLALYFVLRADNRIRIYNVLTGSMEDNIHAGDYILIIKKDEYKVGDIVTFEREGYFITHRIIKKDGSVITTKGDANNVEDENTNVSKIVGKVILIGGILNFVIRYKYALVGSILTLYLLTCIFSKDESEKEEKNKKIKIKDEKELEAEKELKNKKIDEIKEELKVENVDEVEEVKEEKISDEAKKAINDIFTSDKETKEK